MSVFNDDEKRKRRREKAVLKRDGKRKRRRALKRQLDRDPDSVDSKETGYEYRRESSAVWNGEVKDTKRARMDRADEEE